MSLPKRKLCDVLWVSEELLLKNKISSRVAMLVRDVVSFKKSKDDTCNRSIDKRNTSRYLKIYFHNKGITLVNTQCNAVQHYNTYTIYHPFCIIRRLSLQYTMLY